MPRASFREPTDQRESDLRARLKQGEVRGGAVHQESVGRAPLIVMLAFLVAISTFVPLPSTNLACRRVQLYEMPVHLSLAEERLESAKAGAIAVVSGSLLAAPAALLASDAFTAQWEFSTDALALQLALFGVVYRYAVRSDDNDQLRQGAVGAFALTRTLAAARVGEQCTPLPLSCGPPLGYLDWNLLIQLAALFGESALAFGGAAFALEYAWDSGWAQRIPKSGLPTQGNGANE